MNIRDFFFEHCENKQEEFYIKRRSESGREDYLSLDSTVDFQRYLKNTLAEILITNPDLVLPAKFKSELESVRVHLEKIC